LTDIVRTCRIDRDVVPLPIDRSLPQVLEALRRHRALVIVAEPGAGKTTRVPPAIVMAGGVTAGGVTAGNVTAGDLLGAKHPNLVLLQPRRVAARAAAERIAEENNWQLGREVGYHVRFDRKLTDSTRVRVVTEGILTRQLLDDPFLEGVGAVVLDEFHERSIHTDLAIALMREVRQSVRDDLMLIVMSATLEAEPVSKFLGDCPIVRVEGRTFPVEITQESRLGVHVTDQIVDAVTRIASSNEPGDVLIFLPGAPEIRRTMRHMDPLAVSQNLLLVPLHGSLPADEQTRALRPAPAGMRKIICATNIAETSLTIDGVRFVIDSGLARVAGYDARRGLDRLELKRISQASAKQRAGRAGRTAPGKCIRLWSAKELHESPAFELPEIRRVDLAATVLSLHAWGHADVRKFPWYEPPPDATVTSAEKLLAMLGALEGGRITKLGKQMLSLPTHPRLARLMVAAAQHDLVREGATIAAILSEKDFVREDEDRRRAEPALRGSSDLLVRMQMLDRDRHDESIDPNAARQVLRVRDELMRLGRRLGHGSPPLDREEALLKLVLIAYPDRVARRRSGEAGTMVGGGGVRLSRRSVVHDWEFFVAADARHDERNPAKEAVVRMASGMRPEWLEELFPQAVRREKQVRFDEQRGRVVAANVVWYHDLVLRSDPNARVEPADVERALAEAVRPMAEQIVRENESAAALLARIELLRRHMPEHKWPAFNANELADLLGEAAAGKRSIDEIRNADLVSLLRSRLPYPLDRLLDQHAPRQIEVPSGQSHRITYAPGQPPVLAVRLQELFGWTDTPKLAGGRVPLVLHLLGPNYRPVQITDDLKSFWASTYFQVRKDLRVRYPKHSWPEDPLTAKPEAKGSRRR
jgi:ATP-dependent helicase HrpB